MKIICDICGRELELAKCAARSGKWENLILWIVPCDCAKKPAPVVLDTRPVPWEA